MNKLMINNTIIQYNYNNINNELYNNYQLITILYKIIIILFHLNVIKFNY